MSVITIMEEEEEDNQKQVVVEEETMVSLSLRFGSIVLLLIVFQFVVARVGGGTTAGSSSNSSSTNNNLSSSSSISELKRRWQHALTGHILVQASYLNFPLVLSLTTLTIVALVLLYLHQYYWDTIYYPIIAGPYMRKDEIQFKEQIVPSAFYFLIGTIVTTIVFPINIARYSIECLSLCDPIAAYIGQTLSSPKLSTLLLFPKTTTTSKATFITTITSTSTASVSGSVACFLTAIVIGWFMLHQSTNTIIVPTKTLLQIVFGAMACTISEAFPIINDNLSIPIITSLAVYIVEKVMP